MDKNYIMLSTVSFCYIQYVFIDTIDHIYESIMKRSGIILKDIKEYIKKDSPFRLIACRVRKADKELFCRALCQVKNMAMLLGYREYNDMCSLMCSCESTLVNDH